MSHNRLESRFLSVHDAISETPMTARIYKNLVHSKEYEKKKGEKKREEKSIVYSIDERKIAASGQINRLSAMQMRKEGKSRSEFAAGSTNEKSLDGYFSRRRLCIFSKAE